jgi:hypothetical protein
VQEPVRGIKVPAAACAPSSCERMRILEQSGNWPSERTTKGGPWGEARDHNRPSYSENRRWIIALASSCASPT